MRESGLDDSDRPKSDRLNIDVELWVRGIVALLLWTAATAKGYQLATSSVEGNRIWLIAQVEMEWLIGLLLISGIWWRAVRTGTILVFAAMACYSAWLVSRHVESCGCFGLIRVDPWLTLVVDSVVVVALVTTGRRSESFRSRTKLRRFFLLPLALVIGVPAAWLMASYQPAHLDPEGQIIGESHQIVLEPESWTGKPFPLLPHLAATSQLQQGRWKVLLYHHDCGSCAEILERWPESMREDSKEDSRLAIVILPPAEGVNSGFEVLTPQPLVDYLPGSRDWLVTTPTVITLDQGVVTGTSRDTVEDQRKAARTLAKGEQNSISRKKETESIHLERNSEGAYDLGYIEPGSTHKIGLEIVNPLPIPLEIKKIQPECDCMQVLNPPNHLLPGKTSIVVSFQSIKKRVDYSKRVLFHINHEKLSLIAVPIRARIGLALRLEQQTLKLEGLLSGKTHRRQIIVHNEGAKPYKLLYATSNDPRCVAQVGLESILPGKSHALPVIIDLKEAIPGEHSASIRFVTNSPGQRNLGLKLEYRVEE